MTNVTVQKCSLPLPFPGPSSTSFSTVPWPCLAETHQELQVIQAVIKLGGNAPLSEHGRELSGQDTWAPAHESLRGNSRQITPSARSLRGFILVSFTY